MFNQCFSRDGPPNPRAFALTFKKSNRHWDRGDRTPHGPALVLLNVIEYNPQAVIAALSS